MIAITDYDTGNLRSVANALRRIGAEFTVTSDAAVLRQADRVLLPGVGEASSAMAKLRERGLDALIPTPDATRTGHLHRHAADVPGQRGGETPAAWASSPRTSCG